ncbi:DUF6166 domain-containing protein [Nonomuraea bangladeshensis]|uniref:DUF6166 domain-containing protein n=1 Tax=Nonomuraea bangladeshensis TaxID=404385 RepID=UPI003C305D3B
MKLVTPADTTERTYRGRTKVDGRGAAEVIDVLPGNPEWQDLKNAHQQHQVLRELDLNTVSADLPADTFTWGYYGNGPLATSEAILSDALGQVPARDMVHDFCREVVSQLGIYGRDPWLLSWHLVVRWAQAWQTNQT